MRENAGSPAAAATTAAARPSNEREKESIFVHFVWAECPAIFALPLLFAFAAAEVVETRARSQRGGCVCWGKGEGSSPCVPARPCPAHRPPVSEVLPNVFASPGPPPPPPAAAASTTTAAAATAPPPVPQPAPPPTPTNQNHHA